MESKHQQVELGGLIWIKISNVSASRGASKYSPWRLLFQDNIYHFNEFSF